MQLLKKRVTDCETLLPGVITEISGAPGSGKTEKALRLLARSPVMRAAWIEEQFSIYPNAFPQFGVRLERVLFMEAENRADSLWAAHQALRSGLFGAVVLSVRSPLALIELRRLQLAAEKSGAAVVLLTETPAIEGRWAITARLEARR